MLRISLQTLRANRGTLAGAFVALWLGVTLAYATGLLMAGALSAPGPGRFAAADAVGRAEPTLPLAAQEAVAGAPPRGRRRRGRRPRSAARRLDGRSRRRGRRRPACRRRRLLRRVGGLRR